MRLFYFTLILCTRVFAQEIVDKDYFRLPLDIPLQLSGNFGELRSNHFHAGFDFRTQQKEGLKVYAVADGYISRIKISTYGNGKTIYIDHPNGYTTVYGHLQRTNDFIEEYVKKAQYKEQSFEVEIRPNPDEFIVKKGDVIAFSGNTGSSEGPHLHFEFRDTKSEKVINPYLFGYNAFMQDSKRPIVTNLYVYPIDDKSVANQSKRPLLLNLTLQKDGTYLSEKVLADGKIGFGVQAHDVFDKSYDKYAIYQVESYLNGNPSFKCQFDTYSFDEMRYVNAYIDYYRYKTSKVKIQKLFMKTHFPLSIIKTNEANGVIDVTTNFSNSYKIVLSDFYGNKTQITIPIEYAKIESIISEEVKKTNYFVKCKVDANFEKDNFAVFFPAGTFYDDFYLDFDVKDNVMTVHNDLTPVHQNFLVTITDSSKNNDDKTFIASYKNGKYSYNNTKRKDNTFTTYTKKLGQFTLYKDTISPKIKISKPIEGQWISGQKTIQLNISDELSGIQSYNGYINNKWVLFEYENKANKITHYIDDAFMNEGENELKVVVTDNVGNSTIFETHFFRSQKK